jgi:ribonuclease Z
VHSAILDHGIPCLGFSLKESFHINIISQELQAMGLATGRWLQAFKRALYAKAPPDRLIEAPCSDRPGRTRTYPLGALAARIAAITPGQKIAYVADVAFHEANARRIRALAHDADHLFVEGAFLDEDRAIARQKKHLTAGQAGELAAQAGVKRVTVFHFSPRYEGRIQRLQEQAQRAFRETRARL